jgi:hypothetical protein
MLSPGDHTFASARSCVARIPLNDAARPSGACPEGWFHMPVGGNDVNMLDAAIQLAQRGEDLTVDLTLNGIIALAAGVLILLFPRLLNYLVAGYLIIVGLIDIFDVRL